MTGIRPRLVRNAQGSVSLVAVVVLVLSGVNADQSARAGDWPQLGGSSTRNNVSPATGLPSTWSMGEVDRATGRWIGGPTARNIRWVTPLGTESYGSPAVAGNKIFCGTNNGQGYVPRYPPKVDLGCLLCLSRETGTFLWQYSAPVLPDSSMNWPEQGLCSTPLVERDRLWVVTNRGSAVCFDTEGFYDGENDGPFTQEESTDLREADVVWELNMIERLGVHPRYMTSSSPTAWGDLLFVVTSHGANEKGEIVRPDAPSFLALDKETGEIVWADNSPGDRILEGQWSSPACAVLGGVPQVIFGGGDGWVYSFLAERTTDGKPKLLWKFDANPKKTRFQEGGLGDRNYLVAAPVIADGKVYVVTGQDPQWGEGPGDLWCIDPTKRGDISAELVVDSAGNPVPPRRTFAVDESRGERVVAKPNSGVIWHYRGQDLNGNGKLDFEETLHRTLGMPAVTRGILVVGDGSGIVHCLDAEKGQLLWTYDMMASVWGSPLIADGKIYLGDEDGDVAVFELAREMKLLAENPMTSSVYTTPVAVDGVLYIVTRRHCVAIGSRATHSTGKTP